LAGTPRRGVQSLEAVRDMGPLLSSHMRIVAMSPPELPKRIVPI
jgi:hypothetical protein